MTDAPEPPASPPAPRYRLVHLLFFVHLLLLIPVVVLVLVLASCGGRQASSVAPAAETVTTTRNPAGVVVHHDNVCSAYDVIAERQRVLADRNAAALARAITEAALTPVDYPVDSFDARFGGGDWEVVEASGRRDLLSPGREDGCGAGNPWRLALDSRGGVVVLLIQARVTDLHELQMCGCPADLPITCGGAAPPVVRWRWALPPGVDFHGPFSLVVDDQASTIGFSGRPDHAPCPLPLMPP